VAVPGISRWQHLSLLALTAAAIGAGSCSLPEVRGHVVDRDRGDAIVGAIVFERFERAAVPGAPPTTLHAGFAESDAAGRFVFPAALASPGLAAQRRDPPRYGFVHPDYGLVRRGEGPTKADDLVLDEPHVSEQDLRMAALMLEDLAAGIPLPQPPVATLDRTGAPPQSAAGEATIRPD